MTQETPETTPDLESSDLVPIESDPDKLRLDLLVEEYDRRVAFHRLRFEENQIPESAYHNSVARERRHLVAMILKTYADSCALGPGYFENLVYTIYRSQIDMDDGVQRAMKRIDDDVRNINNAHGEHFATLDDKQLTHLMTVCSEIFTTKTIMNGMGLHQEAERAVEEIIQRRFGQKPQKTP